MITIRKILPHELSEINSRYNEIDFKLSKLENEYVAIAEFNGAKAGQGRLVFLNSEEAELGGMYVYPEFRGRGIAEKIVQHLLDQSNSFKRIYCLPFENLSNFYSSFGFQESKSPVHPDIQKKYEWCLMQYTTKTLLFEINR